MADIGIDLGTTNSLVAVFDGERPRLIRNASGGFLTPSVVSVTPQSEVLVGLAARERLISHANATAANFKRLMGTERTTMLDHMSYRPEELSALVLRSLKQDAEADLGEPVSAAVISVPAYFNDQQRRATMDAARLAGLEVTRLVNEPTAAALAYGLEAKSDGTFLVFDLGGGTFDVSILDRYDDVMEVKATTGDSRLGGEDFTDVLQRLIVAKAGLALEHQSPSARAIVRRQADAMKHALSQQHDATFDMDLGGGRLEGRLTRQEFETACAPLLARLRGPVERAVRDSGLDPNDFDGVVLVGGATRMQMVKSLVARLFGRLPMVSIDPDTTVALGAAVQAGLSSRNGALKDVVMTDVCPFTLGIAARDEASGPLQLQYVAPIIERNAVVPISRSDTFCTVNDKQTAIKVAVYQGENMRPENNVLLGQLSVPVPSNKAGAEYISVRFTYDVSGMLQVEVTVTSTGKVLSQVFQNSQGMAEEDVALRFKALQHLKLPPREDAANKELLARMERLYEESRGSMRDSIRHMIVEFEREIADQKMRNPEACRKRFATQLDSFEQSPLLGD